MRSACLLAFVAALTLSSHRLDADPIQIISINTSGDLVWVNTNMANGTYRIEYKDYMDDVWETFPGLEQVASTTSTTEVPMDLNDVDEQRFFRVLWLDPPLADSVVDFRATQGNNGWQYGYALPATDQPSDPNWFREMPNFENGTWNVDTDLYWTLISQQTMHPNGAITTGGKTPVDQWAVLRWNSTVNGAIRVEITASDLNDVGGNGVVLRTFQDGVEQATHAIVNGGETSYSVDLTTTVGQKIDLALDANESDDASDVTEYRVLIYQE